MPGYLDQVEHQPVVVDQWQIEKLALAGLRDELFFYAPGVRRGQLGGLAARGFSTIDGAVRGTLEGPGERGPTHGRAAELRCPACSMLRSGRSRSLGCGAHLLSRPFHLLGVLRGGGLHSP